jgi:ribose transport system ATP-binding protein
MSPAPLVVTRNISKNYGGVAALSDISLSARSGEVHALLGENGAGKSSFVKILTGAVTPSSGEIEINGVTYSKLTPKLAREIGIAAVTQELSLIPVLTGAENIWFPKEPIGRFRGRKKKQMISRAKQVLEKAGLPLVELDIPVSEMGIGPRQILEIAKAVARNPKILILDESTSALGSSDVELVLGMVRRMAEQGVLCFYISHRIAEIKSLCDRITVLRGGQSIGTFSTHEIEEPELINLMIGRSMGSLYPKWESTATEDVVLDVQGVSATHQLTDVSFALRKGEVLGVGGLQDQGQLQLFLRLCGASKGDGRVLINGREANIRNPRAALSEGIGCAYMPEDRQRDGLLLKKSIRENLVLTRMKSVSRFGFMRRSAEDKLCRQLVDQFSIKANGIEQEVGALSGGNQQKVLVAKYILPRISTFLWYDPTRGIDVGAKQEIFELMRKQTSEGKSILFYSTDTSELSKMCDRVIVLSNGKIVATLNQGEINDESILKAAFTVLENADNS